MNKVFYLLRTSSCILTVCLLWSVTAEWSHSQIVQQAVGGVSVNADGVVDAPTVQDEQKLDRLRNTVLDEVPNDLKAFTKLRAVSLKQLEAQVARHLANGEPLSDEVKYLAGLQRVEYVFVYPEQNDVVLAGPAEGWQVDKLGNVVGITTGRPVVLLDDLLVALRTRETVQLEAISCSIDPTAEGIQQLRALNRRLRTIGNPESTLRQMEEALGPQTVTVTGVPQSSHFARTLVAADFRMKRLAMNFQPAPIDNMPSFLHLLSQTRGNVSMTPRWWLAPNYEPLAQDADGLAWELRGQAVMCMTEEDHFNAAGERVRSVKASPAATQWAETLTEQFTELANHDSAFGQLRNAMDLAVVAALLDKQQLLQKAHLELPSLLHEQPIVEYHSPQWVASKASFVKRRGEYLISTSGGVQILPWKVVENIEQDESVAEVRNSIANPGNHWYW